MTRTRLSIAALLIAVLAPVLPGRAADAVAPETPVHVVHAGAKDPTDKLSMHMYEAYFPSRLRVHKGDRVRWEFPNQVEGAQAFHTVTFGNPDDASFARADEAPGSIAFDERTFFGTGCGRGGQPVCVISSSDRLVSSGTPIQHSAGVDKVQPFDVKVDLPVGTYTYFCTIHHPKMQGTIEVVADKVALKNPKPADLTGEIVAQTKRANARFSELSQPRLVVEGGRRVWTVASGADAKGDIHVSTERFLPGSLEVRAGDTVRWVNGGTAHTVTFPDTTAGLGGPPQHLAINCEFDEPASGAPGVPLVGTAGATGLLWCPPGGSLEMGITPLGASPHRAPSDAITSPATFHSSGIMINGGLTERLRGAPARSGKHFPSQFEATFPTPGTYTYRCLMHWTFMTGSITVK